ncbi:MAG TPA: hypothetical protein VGJ20_31240 [Xanthobacteraceae bacterium]
MLYSLVFQLELAVALFTTPPRSIWLLPAAVHPHRIARRGKTGGERERCDDGDCCGECHHAGANKALTPATLTGAITLSFQVQAAVCAQQNPGGAAG